MSFVDELKPALSVARLMGMAPYKIEKDNLKISPFAVLYSSIVNSIYLSVLYFRIPVKKPSRLDFHTFNDIQYIGVTLIIFGCFFHFFFSLLNHRKFREFVSNVNNFDVMTDLDQLTKKHSFAAWMYVLLPIAILMIARTYLYYSVNYTRTWIVWQGFFIFVGFYTGIYQYTFMVSCILQRFRHLNRVVEQGPNDLVVTGKFLRKPIGLRQVWILYAHLMNATEKFNSIFSIQLLIWICALAVCIITRIYTIWNKDIDEAFADFILNSVTALICVLLLINLTGICHLTASEANNFAATVFRVNSRILQSNHRWDHEDTFAIGQFFILRRFNFTAAGGFLQIGLPLLQNIAAGITTYLVILKPSSEP